MGFNRLSTVETLTLPIGEHEYTIDAVDADLGIFLHELTDLTARNREAERQGIKIDIPESQANRIKELAEKFASQDTLLRMLGTALDEMRENGVPWTTIQLVAGTVMQWTVAGREAAEEYWNHGGNVPKVRRPQDHRAGSGTAKSTKKRASTSGTNKPRKGQRGPSSSPTGH